MKLDKTKSYGEIYGRTPDGARFHQDGRYFDAHGDEIVRKAAVEEPVAPQEDAKPAARPGRKPKAAVEEPVAPKVANPIDEQIAAQLGG
ncbi:hypothetical protein [Pseudothauera rhizosphaerae]|uniref:Uncharacterized protein n=1 Tax=Pseudothauera rhizosphaerae TaxID=2565932 RepID=A0A4S4AAI6_9RHOO|nr:hypothetical protein [Pseudothauera rhizosphaerae]THF55917.1 hypothetical protein E6O51_20235 [Pseudothauera rhizosphaerae]